MSKRTIAVALGAAALLVPGTATAAKGTGHGKGAEKVAAKQEKKKAKGDKKSSKAKKGVTYVFKGVYAGAGVVSVKSGNAHVRKGGYVGSDVTFDMASAKVVAAEFDGVAGVTAADLQVGDEVLVQAKQARGTKAPAAAEEGADAVAPAAIKARKVVDKTHPPVEETDDEEAVPAP